MTELFELLYHAWCPPCDLSQVPDYLKSDPVAAQGQHAFEEGFKLGVQLMYLALDPNYLSDAV